MAPVIFNSFTFWCLLSDKFPHLALPVQNLTPYRGTPDFGSVLDIPDIYNQRKFELTAFSGLTVTTWEKQN